MILKRLLLVVVLLGGVLPALAQGDDNPLPAPPGLILVGDETGLYSMNADGTEKVYVAQTEQAGCWLRDGKWSPDNTQVVYTEFCGGSDPTDWRSANRTAIIHLYDVESQSDEVLLETDGTSQDYVGGWSPNGEELVLYSNRGTSFIYNLFLLDIDRQELTQLTDFDSNAGRATFDPTGQYVLYNRYDAAQARWDIRALDVNDPTSEILVAVGLTPNWSPDGKWIAYTSERNASSDLADVFVMPTDCIYNNTACEPGQEKNITYTPEIGEREPLWSADQTQIIYLRNTNPTPGAELWDIFRQELKTGRLVKLTDTTDVSERHTDWQRTETAEIVEVETVLPVVVSVTSATLNLRNGPSTGAQVAGQPVSNGQFLFVQSVNTAGDWYYITLPADGTSAWVFGDFTQTVEGDPTTLPVRED